MGNSRVRTEFGGIRQVKSVSMIESVPFIYLQFGEAFDAMTDKGLGVGVKQAGYHLQLFGIHPSYQRQGVGSAMDKAVEEYVSKFINMLKKTGVINVIG